MLIANKTENSVKISLIGEIMGDNAWMDSDAADFGLILAQADGAPLDLWVSSPGGSLDAAMAMRAMLAEYAGPITIHTAGRVASAATLLLCVPQARVIAHRGSIFMVHKAGMVSEGNADEMRKSADILDVCDDEIIKVYQIRLKCGEDELRDMMRAETWMRPEEAQAMGLVDEISAATSGGYVAELINPQPDRSEDIREAISACLTPRIEAIQTGLTSISASGETRVRAIQNAAESAVSGIVEASAKSATEISAAGEAIGKVVAEQLQILRDEIAECRRSYNKQAEKYAALDEALSRVYALSGGDINFFTTHDEDRRAKPFKLNV
jgi:ATP-dependent protease ClpP protease subunit/vacuolar-type H+-ATPase subunit H